ncbi:DISARM system SNF2-like helicase DrmD [Sphingomonas sp. Leaf4]|uniref:DISARM system SNF2-like helicase DrmD n=1 Tax=Sphingomonas sp. Leaf4 TaxID=2876553 RepID=UPI001E5672DD|nr:DISARM system SNF2-like helicase DrmD [Sphingomonas sp. Leaf4]
MDAAQRRGGTGGSGPSIGQFVSLRGRLWLVEGEPDGPYDGHYLACVDDDAGGEEARVLWSAEIDPRLRDEEAWDTLANGGGDARLFAAYLRTVRWRTATAAERDLFQAPFRAGIRLDPYQLLPLRKALRLPRVNLLIADDVGLGKTVEAGLILRELLLRRRVDYAVVIAPAAMTGQWREELQTKFGLAFEIVDRQHLETLRRRRGYGANPWATGSRFILSHRLLTDEAYVAGLRDVLEDFRARSLLILDEAHHAAPSGGGRYAIESQFTRALRDLSDRFEHRLFLSATPHNGHANSFATLLELLDPQRFTRGVPVRPADLEPVMVRRLKSDLRALGEAFPERVVEPVVLTGLPADAPELRLAAMLAAYRDVRERRIGTLGGPAAARARLAFVGLQQRLLSSIPAFARTLRVHLTTLDRAIAGTAAAVSAPDDVEVEPPERADQEAALLDRLDTAAADQAEAATLAGIGGASHAHLLAERACAAEMLDLAERVRGQGDARVRWLLDWAATHLLDGDGRWRDRRLILFTEYEDTRRWLERQLGVLLDPSDGHEASRIASFTGITSIERREAIKRAFNDPDDPLRILICTDAAREGINLQAQCHDLIHVDLPWNPARLEQRNGRIDRKLQPSPTVTCRYFVYADRPEDVVLDALVRKTELIRRQLGSAGQVLGARIADRMGGGIARTAAIDLAARIRDEEADERVRAAVRDLDDGDVARRARLKREQAELAVALERARRRVGVEPDDLRSVVALALERSGGGWSDGERIGETPVFRLDPAFASDAGWQPLFDELRARGPRPGERPGEWRASADAQVRRVSFAPAILPDGRDAGDVVQVHLEHRLVRRLLGQFLSAGFQQGLERACVIETASVPRPRVVLIGRLALFGERAARLHEEVMSVAADWRPAPRDGLLRALAEGGEAEGRVLDGLIAALGEARMAAPDVAAAITAQAAVDVADLRPVLAERAAVRQARIAAELDRRAADEADTLHALLQQRIDRIRRERGSDDRQFALLLDPAEARQRAADRRSWERAATRLDDELVREPERLRAAARVRASRLEPIGLVYLHPPGWSGE